MGYWEIIILFFLLTLFADMVDLRKSIKEVFILEEADLDPSGLIVALLNMGARIHGENKDIIAEHSDISIWKDGTVICNGSSVKPREGYGYNVTQDGEGIARFSPAISN